MRSRQRSASSDQESGYASASSSTSLPDVYFSRTHLKFINAQLSTLEPPDILKWCITTLPHLYQTTAFGLTGLAIIDMLSKLDYPLRPDLDCIFLDTLFHFPQTLALLERVQARYPRLTVHSYRPHGCQTTADFEAQYGDRLWERDDERYDFVAKVEPAQRAYRELDVAAVITGRRRTQGGKRGDLDILEVDEAGLIKINPLANWSFTDVQSYIAANQVPTNELLAQGYRSVGDWHSTQPVKEGEDERAGRWKGQQKTECGIHNKRSRYAMFLQEQEEKRVRELTEGIDSGLENSTPLDVIRQK